VKIVEVASNNRKRAFRIRTEEGEYDFPHAKLTTPPTPEDPVVEVYADEELGNEAFTYRLKSGAEDTVHMDAVLEYNEDPAYVNEVLLHHLTVEARKALKDSGLSKREVIRTLGTSAGQLYRLLDPANSSKSVGQMVALLHVLGRDVDVVVTPRNGRPNRRGQRKRAV